MEIKKFEKITQNFDEMVSEFKDNEQNKTRILNKSRELIKNSKRIIYSIHRNKIQEAEKLTKEVESEFSKLNEKVGIKELMNYNLYKGALQEYVEAKTFLDFILSGKISTSKELKINYHDYLCGLADLTGELGRYAVAKATKGDFEKVVEIKEFVDYLLGNFLKFDFNNGELRKKYDAIKWNLNKIESIVYDQSLRKK